MTDSDYSSFSSEEEDDDWNTQIVCLDPFQRKAVGLLEATLKTERLAFLTTLMGTGKTLMGLFTAKHRMDAYVQQHKTFSMLVFATVSNIHGWQKEAKRIGWNLCTLEEAQFTARSRKTPFLVITNREALVGRQGKVSKQGQCALEHHWNLVVYDEAHALGNWINHFDTDAAHAAHAQTLTDARQVEPQYSRQLTKLIFDEMLMLTATPSIQDRDTALRSLLQAGKYPPPNGLDTWKSALADCVRQTFDKLAVGHSKLGEFQASIQDILPTRRDVTLPVPYNMTRLTVQHLKAVGDQIEAQDKEPTSLLKALETMPTYDLNEEDNKWLSLANSLIQTISLLKGMLHGMHIRHPAYAKIQGKLFAMASRLTFLELVRSESVYKAVLQQQEEARAMDKSSLAADKQRMTAEERKQAQKQRRVLKKEQDKAHEMDETDAAVTPKCVALLLCLLYFAAKKAQGVPPDALDKATLSRLAKHIPQTVVISSSLRALEAYKKHMESVFPDLEIELFSGKVHKKERGPMNERFESGKTRVLLLSLEAGGTGLNLRSAQLGVVCNEVWSQSKQNQGIARMFRRCTEGKHKTIPILFLGQKSDGKMRYAQMYKLSKQASLSTAEKESRAAMFGPDWNVFMETVKEECDEDNASQSRKRKPQPEPLLTMPVSKLGKHKHALKHVLKHDESRPMPRTMPRTMPKSMAKSMVETRVYSTQPRSWPVHPVPTRQVASSRGAAVRKRIKERLKAH